MDRKVSGKETIKQLDDTFKVLGVKYNDYLTAKNFKEQKERDYHTL